MQNQKQIRQVVVVGGGPVGNFSALMVSMLGVACIVYEKRGSYTRQINLKIQKDFFKNVGKILNGINQRNDEFFQALDQSINQRRGKILLKTLESSLKQQAVRFGAKYNTGKEIKTFQQVQKLHTNSLILDCTGRNSLLRVNQFGNDQQNMRIYNLHHALHINFKAAAPKNFDFKLLYPVLKNSENLKLGQIIISKKKDVQQKFAHVTVPLFISDKLSDIIDQKYPNINRLPLRPFSIKDLQSIEQQVEQVIYSLFCALAMENWEVDWKSVLLKKINITCGYAFNRSKDRYVCLGDSAAHFAYFKSLNFGLKHAFQLVKILSNYSHLKFRRRQFDQKQAVNRFWKINPILWPTKARQSSSLSNLFITTSQVGILAPYTFNMSNNDSTRISILPQISQQKIQNIFDEYQKQQKQLSWQYYVDKFQKIRKFDIEMQIISNKNKKTGSEIIAYFIWLNGLSPIKISENISLVANGYYLDKKDFNYFSNTIGSLKKSISNCNIFRQNIQKKVKGVLEQKKGKLSNEFEQFLQKLSQQCIGKQFKHQQFSKLVLSFRWESKQNKNKEITLLYKAFYIIANVILQDNLENQQSMIKQVNQEGLVLM